MSDIRRKIAIAKSLERIRKIDLDDKLRETANARELVEYSQLKLDEQEALIESTLDYAYEYQEKDRALRSGVLEAQSDYFSKLHIDLNGARDKLEESQNIYSNRRGELILAHAKKRLASKNKESLKSQEILKNIKQDLKDNFQIEESSSEGLS